MFQNPEIIFVRQKILMKKNLPMPIEEEEIGKKKEKFKGGKKDEEDEEDEEEFWMDMVGLRTAKFGIGLASFGFRVQSYFCEYIFLSQSKTHFS